MKQMLSYKLIFRLWIDLIWANTNQENQLEKEEENAVNNAADKGGQAEKRPSNNSHKGNK